MSQLLEYRPGNASPPFSESPCECASQASTACLAPGWRSSTDGRHRFLPAWTGAGGSRSNAVPLITTGSARSVCAGCAQRLLPLAELSLGRATPMSAFSLKLPHAARPPRSAGGRVEAKWVSNCSPQTGPPPESREENLDGTANDRSWPGAARQSASWRPPPTAAMLRSAALHV